MPSTTLMPAGWSLLERALDTRDVDALLIIPVLPEMADRYPNPRYRKLLERMGVMP